MTKGSLNDAHTVCQENTGLFLKSQADLGLHGLALDTQQVLRAQSFASSLLSGEEQKPTMKSWQDEMKSCT